MSLNSYATLRDLLSLKNDTSAFVIEKFLSLETFITHQNQTMASILNTV